MFPVVSGEFYSSLFFIFDMWDLYVRTLMTMPPSLGAKMNFTPPKILKKKLSSPTGITLANQVRDWRDHLSL